MHRRRRNHELPLPPYTPAALPLLFPPLLSSPPHAAGVRRHGSSSAGLVRRCAHRRMLRSGTQTVPMRACLAPPQPTARARLRRSCPLRTAQSGWRCGSTPRRLRACEPVGGWVTAQLSCFRAWLCCVVFAVGVTQGLGEVPALRQCRCAGLFVQGWKRGALCLLGAEACFSPLLGRMCPPIVPALCAVT